MNKEKYYVSVQAGTLLRDQGAAAYEFEIHATAKEAAQLQEIMELMQEAAESTFARAPIPGIPYHYDIENDYYDEQMKAVYERLHQLGTEETKQHIDNMGILQ